MLFQIIFFQVNAQMSMPVKKAKKMQNGNDSINPHAVHAA